MEITNKELGVWFGIDGVAIKNQSQLDLAVISLARNYGFRQDEDSNEFLEIAHKYFHEDIEREEDAHSSAVETLILVCEEAIRFLNKLAGEQGFVFTFDGEDYDTLVLKQLDNVR